MYLVDFSRAFNENRRVIRLSSTISDLVSQQPSSQNLSASAVGEIFQAAGATMTPYPTTNVTMTVSAIRLTPRADNSCCTAKVDWSYTHGGALRPCNTPLQLVTSAAPPDPGNILAAMLDPAMLGSATSGQLIVADVQDSYQPLFSVLMSFFSRGLQKTTYSLPRGLGSIELQAPPSPSTGEQGQICPSG
jgi:Flp pilus assembly protein TadG